MKDLEAREYHIARGKNLIRVMKPRAVVSETLPPLIQSRNL